MKNKLCDGCDLWERHKDKCWYYWENKRICTQHKEGYKDIDIELKTILKRAEKITI